MKYKEHITGIIGGFLAFLFLSATVNQTALSFDGTNDAVLLQGATATGVIEWYAGENTPNGYFLCNGDAISRTENESLFNVIGEIYGTGDGSTTFNLPNLISGNRFIRGDSIPATMQDDATSVNGLTVSEAGQHRHTTAISNNNGVNEGYGRTTITFSNAKNVNSTGSVYTNYAADHTHVLSGDTETRPINISFRPIIKY